MNEDIVDEAELELESDGRARLRIADRCEIEVDPDGRPTMNISALSAIGVEDLAHVAAYTIVRDAGGTTHQLEFDGGGTASVSFDEGGKLRDLVAEGCGMSLVAGGALVLKRYNERPQD